MSPCHEETSGLDVYFSHQNTVELHNNNKLVATEMGRVHILSNASLSNCSGTITTIEFCYETKESSLNQPQGVFDLLFLAQREAMTFTVERIIYVTTTPRNNTSCTASENGVYVCCESEFLSEVEHFQVPTPNSTYIGVRSTQTRNSILHFANATAFGANEFVILNDSTVGAKFEFTAANQTEGSLLLRFRTGLPITHATLKPIPVKV